MTKLIQKFRRDEKGVTLVEYGIALVLAITVGGAALGFLAAEVDGQMGAAEVAMGGTAGEG